MLISRNARGKSINQILTQNPYICYDSQSWGGLKAHRYLKDNKIRIEAFYELDALEAIEKLVQQQMGVSLVPYWAGLDLNNSGLDAKVINAENYGRKVVLVSLRNGPRPNIVEALCDALKAS